MTRYQAEAMDELCRRYRRAQESLIHLDDRRILALEAAQEQTARVLLLLRHNHGKRASAEYPVAGRDPCDCKGIAGDNGRCDDMCRRAGLR